MTPFPHINLGKWVTGLACVYQLRVQLSKVFLYRPSSPVSVMRLHGLNVVVQYRKIEKTQCSGLGHMERGDLH